MSDPLDLKGTKEIPGSRDLRDQQDPLERVPGETLQTSLPSS